MAQPKEQQNAILSKLEEIRSLLQSLLIIEGARAGLSRDQVRDLASVRTRRVSAVWGSVKKKADQRTD